MHLPARVVRFGSFVLDLRAAELRHGGLVSRLPEQPFQILAALLEHPGDVVTREELRQRLWPSGTFVDFEHGLNAAVKRLREALGDSAETPRFIETVPRHGYRLMVPAEVLDPPSPVPASPPRPWRPILWTLAAAAIALGALLWQRGPNGRVPPASIGSLAVLPLATLSDDPQEETFANGMTEVLVSELGQIGSLRVLARHSTLRFRGTTQGVPQIARELGVDAVMEGSVLCAQGRVRITVQLIQATPERHLWDQSYERDLGDVLRVQHQVAEEVAAQVEAALATERKRSVAGVR
jgi:TolB-like protein/DNA-binding winged helix-turn-helix (wHTH) protein